MDEIADSCIYYIYNAQSYIFFNLHLDCMTLKDLSLLCLNDVRHRSSTQLELNHHQPSGKLDVKYSDSPVFVCFTETDVLVL